MAFVKEAGIQPVALWKETGIGLDLHAAMYLGLIYLYVQMSVANCLNG